LGKIEEKLENYINSKSNIYSGSGFEEMNPKFGTFRGKVYFIKRILFTVVVGKF
jgi:hypothetical protein